MTDNAVVCAPLALERFALRTLSAGVPLVRTGYGPARSARSVAAIGPGLRSVLVAGVGGGVGPNVRPGDVVVASEVRGDGTVTPCPSSPLLAGALRRAGLTVHTGPIRTSARIVHGADRRLQADDGTLAVDLESATLLQTANGGASAAVRVVVDTAEAPLLRPSTVSRGLRALRNLHTAAPAIGQWAAAAGERELLLASPRSFCAGVERAIEIVERALARYGAPVYVRRQIVHNAHVVEDLQARGVVFVDEVEQVPRGAVTVLAAHGVAPEVRAAAARRELRLIDATCPLVTKVHNEVRRYAARGDTVLLIGHRNHEEVVGTVGEAPGRVRVVEDVAGAESVIVDDPDRVASVMQTTLSLDEAADVTTTLRRRFPALRTPRADDICYATTNRQRAVRAIAEQSDLALVIGSANSSNSVRLVETAERAGATAHLVEDVGAVELGWLVGARRVGITAGASAPPHLVDELVQCLGGLGPVTIRSTEVSEENIRFTLPREVS